MKVLSDKLYFFKVVLLFFFILLVIVLFIFRLFLLENICSCRFGCIFSIVGGCEVSGSGDDFGVCGRGLLYCLCCVVDGGKFFLCDGCDSKCF